jgi:hypothetical protein
VKKTLNILGFCIDLRVVAAFALVAGATFVLAPQLFWTALPVLAILACPISMFVMMRAMNSTNSQGRMPGAVQSPAAAPLSRGAQLRDLQAQLERVQSHQAEIAREIQRMTDLGQPATARDAGRLSRS